MMSYFLVEWEEKHLNSTEVPRIKSIRYYCNPINMFGYILKNNLRNYAVFKAEVVIEVEQGEYIT